MLVRGAARGTRAPAPVGPLAADHVGAGLARALGVGAAAAANAMTPPSRMLLLRDLAACATAGKDLAEGWTTANILTGRRQRPDLAAELRQCPKLPRQELGLTRIPREDTIRAR